MSSTKKYNHPINQLPQDIQAQTSPASPQSMPTPGLPNRQKIRKGLILFSFFLFPALFYYFSPVLILEASSQGIINGSFLFFLILFVSSLLVGRAFCGWICPGAGCQEALFLAQDRTISRGDWLKWVLWVPWIGAIVALAIKAGGYRQIDLLYRTTFGLSIGNVQGLIVYLAVVLGLIVLPSYVFGKRAFCHTLCWMAPFMILGRKIRNRFQRPSLQLQTNATLCQQCHACSKSCPMSLPVENMVCQEAIEHPECILCGSCVDACRHGAVRYNWK